MFKINHFLKAENCFQLSPSQTISLNVLLALLFLYMQMTSRSAVHTNHTLILHLLRVQLSFTNSLASRLIRIALY